LPDDWIDYCLCKETFKNKFYSNFQPIPTVGLFFNSSVDDDCKDYNFTNHYYYDAEGT
jgi:hypothetical protein